MPDPVWHPPNFYPVIVAGATWHWEPPPFIDTTTGGWFDWTAEPTRWLLEAEIRDRHDQLLARLASTGTRDGDITGDADGLLAFDLAAAVTAELPPTRTYVSSSDPRVAVWRNRGFYAFDVVVTDHDTDEIWPLLAGVLTVQQSPTI